MISKQELVTRRTQYLIALYNSKQHFDPPVEDKYHEDDELQQPPVDNPTLDALSIFPPAIDQNTIIKQGSAQSQYSNLTELNPFQSDLSDSIFDFLTTYSPDKQHFLFCVQWLNPESWLRVKNDAIEFISHQQDSNWFTSNDYLSFRWTYLQLLKIVDTDISQKESIKEWKYSSGVRDQEVARYKEWLHQIRKIDHPYQPELGQQDFSLSQIELEFYPKFSRIIDQSRLRSEALTKLTPSVLLLNPALSALEHLLDDDIKIDQCKMDGCSKIFIKFGKRTYCSSECIKQSKHVADGRLAPSQIEAIITLLKTLAHQQRSHTAEEIYQYLTDADPRIFPRTTTGGYTIANWLRNKNRLEQLYFLTYSATITKQIPDRLTYTFQSLSFN